MITFVPTPIGNLSDITLRALDSLREADMICCEDTRHSRPLLKHFEIDKTLISLHDHNEAQRVDELIDKATNGANIAVISDAGMPMVSDPGYRLMQAALKHGIAATVLPGPSAVLTALAGSGFPTHAFFFGGFLSVKKGKRRTALEIASQADFTSLFFESPHRIGSTLEIIADINPELPVCVARELSKKFETYHRGTAAEVHAYFQQRKAKGEIVLVINKEAEVFPAASVNPPAV
ncbi:16S rRNA (cytidine(1402)-2'-O)-methyltransferase [Persicirhabdus sediminis]|uniref:Ribosomal RNA small subunit methyltransferase I n=1 Tax=Persicirhabdus sediminis TaxID=454144 RepID=A0A8J7MBA3_9BACT|nr:16S rRNA (cytidine(1402)-2'-O)-methyltransferase [Persicirhabdus sediminis]MBK1789878.1 16S rRNA (cytidine(1402)-2'-O)-methyltransferase [Persicirhabdus sediminis]